MNRRAFITSAGVTAAATTGSIVFARRATAQSSGPNTNLYVSSGAAHSIATGNSFYGSPSGSDWNNAGNSLQPVLSDWLANGLDSHVAAYVGGVNPASVKSTNMNMPLLLQSIQQFQPAFQMADLQNALSGIDASPASTVSSVISTIQQQGMSSYINSTIQQAPPLANAVSAKYSGGGSSGSTPQNQLRRGMVNPNVARIEQPPPSDGGGYNCAADGMAVAAATIAFAVLTVMTMGADAVLVGAAWGAIATWGGLGTAAWGTGHYMVGCGF